MDTLIEQLKGAGVGAAIVALVTVVLRYLLNGRKLSMSEKTLMDQLYQAHFKRLEDRIAVLEQENRECNRRNDKLENDVVGLRQQIAQMEFWSATAHVVCDAAGNITEWSPAAASMFHWSRGEAIGKSISMLVPERLRDQHLKSFAAAKIAHAEPTATHAVVRESVALERSGAELPVTIVLSSWRHKDELFFSAAIKRR